MTGFRWTSVTAAIALLVGSGLAGSDTSGGSAAAAEGPPSRLAGAADRVTFRARPTVVFSTQRVTLSGSVDNGRAGENVKIQAKDCGSDFFRVVSGAITEAGGGWSTFYWLPGPSTTLRAVWNDATSPEVRIQKRAGVTVRKRPGGRFEVSAFGRLVWRKRVFVERFDSRLGTWQAVKTVVLTESEYSRWASATFTVRLPKGTLIRAVFPRSQAGPCYLTGTSNTLRT